MEQIHYSINLDVPYVGAVNNDPKAHLAHYTDDFENYLYDIGYSVTAP